MLQLQDLIVALRAFPPRRARSRTSSRSRSIRRPKACSGCSSFLPAIGSRATPGDTEMIVNGLRTNLGMQNIRIGGVRPNTHFAQVLLECDYRMKLIGIGMEKPPVKIASYVDRATGQLGNCAGTLVLHSRLQVGPRGRRQPGPGTGRRHREAGFREPARRRTTAAAPVTGKAEQGQRTVHHGLHEEVSPSWPPSCRSSPRCET